MAARTHLGMERVSLVAFVSSLAAHGLGLGGLIFVGLSAGPAGRSLPDTHVLGLPGFEPPIAVAPDDLTFIDLAVESAVVPALPDPARSPDPVGDETMRVVEESSPRLASSVDPRAAASDSGAHPGRVPDRAFRRDRESAKAQLTDGAERYQPSRMELARAASSPQAVRREFEVGVGDVVKGGRRRIVALVAATRESEDAADAERVPRPDDQVAIDGAAGPGSPTGTGPLAASQGPRLFDVDAVGAAREVADLRAASDERAPAAIEYSAPSAPGPSDGTSGNGPAVSPGATARASVGVAPTLNGARTAASPGPSVAISTTEEPRVRYEREIKRRAGRALRFPSRMALMLEQGETIVEFVVGNDGRLRGSVALLKSAGFDEFDEEAVSAVQRAAPYPKMPGALTIRMRIPFENPVVR